MRNSTRRRTNQRLTDHACRIMEPSECQPDQIRYVRSGKADLIVCRPKGMSKTRLQSIRYPIEIWNEAQARESCGRRGGRFDPAQRQYTGRPLMGASKTREIQIKETPGFDKAIRQNPSTYADIFWFANPLLVKAILKIMKKHPYSNLLSKTIISLSQDKFPQLREWHLLVLCHSYMAEMPEGLLTCGSGGGWGFFLRWEPNR